MKREIKEAKQAIQEQIEELNSQMALLDEISGLKSINEELWHNICETPLRGTQGLVPLVKTIFKQAKNIEVHSNYVKFTLYEIGCYLPTSRRLGVEIDTSWYSHIDIDEIPYKDCTITNMIRYLECKNQGMSNDKILSYIYPQYKNKPKFYKKLVWRRYKNQYNADTIKYELAEYNKKILQLKKYKMDKKAKIEPQVNILFTKVIPILKQFSSTINSYKADGMCATNIEQIAKYEGYEM